MSCYGFALLALLSRGPHCSRHAWLGYEGGFGNVIKAMDGPKADSEEKQGEVKKDGSV